MPCAVIVTALSVEYLAVRAHLSNLWEEVHPQGTIYERGSFAANGQTWEIGIVEVGSGNVGVAEEIERVIVYFNPKAGLSVRIAAGIKNVALDNVVAPPKAYSYESSKVISCFRHFALVEDFL